MFFIRCAESTKLGVSKNAECGKKTSIKTFQMRHSAAIFFSSCSYTICLNGKT
jgi:hypothetical protein